MVNRSRTVRRGTQPALALRPWYALDQRSGLPRRSVAGCPVDVCASISPRSGGAHVARRSEGDQRPAPRPVSNRRHGAPAPPSPSMRAARRSRAARIPRMGGAARSSGPLSPAQTRSGGAQPPVGRPSALGQVRFGPQPGPGRSRSPPLRATGSRSSFRQPPAPTRQGPPAPPPRPPAQFPAGAGTRAHTYARACGVDIFRKNQREGLSGALAGGAGFISGQERACTGLPWVGAGRQPASRGWDGRALRPATAAAPGRSRHADFR